MSALNRWTARPAAICPQRLVRTFRVGGMGRFDRHRCPEEVEFPPVKGSIKISGPGLPNDADSHSRMRVGRGILAAAPPSVEVRARVLTGAL